MVLVVGSGSDSSCGGTGGDVGGIGGEWLWWCAGSSVGVVVMVWAGE